MWIERLEKRARFIEDIHGLKGQVLVVRGARQVGKTSFILNVLEKLVDMPQLRLNLLYPSTFRLDGIEYLGRDFFGRSENGEEFLKNLESKFGTNEKSAVIFIDEVDRHPAVMESIQTLAQFSDRFKFILTGSNLENISVKNAATGRKRFFDLFPITFGEFLAAGGYQRLLETLDQFSFEEGTSAITEFQHNQLKEIFKTYIRIGGMPKIVDAYLSGHSDRKNIPDIVKDLAVSIEENVKTVLGEKSKLYEYEDILRKLAHFSTSTLKYTHLHVQHAGRSEAKKLVAKTVGARVAHKIRLYGTDSDLSKYIIFDCGIANYLLSGSDLLGSQISERNMAVLCETFVGNEIISQLTTRDDLFYWRSENMAEVEYMLRSPPIGIDVKARRGDSKSLNSLAIFEPTIEYLVKISDALPSFDATHTSSLPNMARSRKVPLIILPHYLTCRLIGVVRHILDTLGL